MLVKIHSFADEHESVVVPKVFPRAVRNACSIDKFPVAKVVFSHLEVVAGCRGDVESCTAVQVGAGKRIAKDILPVVSTEGTAVLPLRKDGLSPMMDGEPTTLQDGLALPLKAIAEPRDNLPYLGLGVTPGDITVRKRAIEGILAGGEPSWGVGLGIAVPGVRIIVAAIIPGPVGVPGASVIRNGIPGRRALPDPENRGHDVPMPGILAKS